MNIRIVGVKYAPRWEALQSLICQMTATKGRLTRIARLDRSCDYRAPGDYELEFQPEGKADLVVVGLSIEP